MKKKYFNRRNSRRQKGNLKKYAGVRALFSKRTGGILNVSVLMENRNLSSKDFEQPKNKI